MGLLRQPSYRMALLKFINLVRKKKPSAQKPLSTIMSVGADEDLHSELPARARKDKTLNELPEDSAEKLQSKTIKSKNIIPEKALVAGNCC